MGSVEGLGVVARGDLFVSVATRVTLKNISSFLEAIMERGDGKGLGGVATTRSVEPTGKVASEIENFLGLIETPQVAIGTVTGRCHNVFLSTGKWPIQRRG
jgi:hypothetical protein